MKAGLYNMISMFKFYSTVALFLLFIEANPTKYPNWTTCEARDSLGCKCTSDVMSDVIARCHFKHVTDIRRIINNPQNIRRLNLSGNNFQEIPQNSFSNYSQLIYLSLSFNNIRIISDGAFNGLTKLRELNLQGNMIKHWETTSVQQDLPNLIMVNIAENIYWKPDQPILSLPNLKIIILMVAFYARVDNVSCSYVRCYLVKRNYSIMRRTNNALTENTFLGFKEIMEPGNCFYNKIISKDVVYNATMNQSEFYSYCGTIRHECFLFSQLRANKNSTEGPRLDWFYLKEIIRPYCWNLLNKIHILTLVEGICGIMFNMVVIITTLRSRVLRESVAHVLVANISVGDILSSIYLIIVTSTRQMMDGREFYAIYQPYYCRFVGFVFLIGQLSSPMMSFIMTLERYIAVVHCMRPHIRLTIRRSIFAMALVWSLSISLAVSFMTSQQFSMQTDSMCVPLSNNDKRNVLHFVVGVGFALFIIAIALYGHMYLDFQKTSQKTVQLQRENRLARSIALVMFTNVLFFILPLLFYIIITVNKGFVGYTSKLNLYILLKTFTIICLGINPCINPILFSFRNEKFRCELRRNCVFVSIVGFYVTSSNF